MAGRVRLVASDVDGTLLIDWDPRGIDARVLSAIRELARRDVRFVVASGRQHACLRRLFSPVADEVAYLCENGAMVAWRGEVLLSHAMPRDLALEVCHAIMGTPGCELEISGVRTSYALARESAFIDHLRRVVGDNVEPVARPEDVPEDIIKVSCHATDEAMRAAGPALERRFGGSCKVVTSGATWMDVMARGVDKGAALAELSGLWGIGAHEMMAFGDNDNDREMLGYVGHPYLMASGNPALRGLNARLRTCESVHEALGALLAAPGVF